MKFTDFACEMCEFWSKEWYTPDARKYCIAMPPPWKLTLGHERCGLGFMHYLQRNPPVVEVHVHELQASKEAGKG